MIIETSDNHFYRVTEPKEPEIAHLYHGFRVVKKGGKFVEAPKAQLTSARPQPASWSSSMKRPPEMSRRQFQEALQRNGFKQVLLWFQDTTGQVTNTSWGGLLMPGTGKLARRATLSYLIRERAAEVAKREKVPA